MKEIILYAGWPGCQWPIPTIFPANFCDYKPYPHLFKELPEGDFIDEPDEQDAFSKGYIAGANIMRKRISDLEAHIERLNNSSDKPYVNHLKDIVGVVPDELSKFPDPNYAGNWTEDYSHENGNYHNKCCECGNSFIGHKRRFTCKVCAALPSSDKTQKEK